jgi:hypothetical protein
MQFLNLTPHTITIRRTGALNNVLLDDIVVPPDGTVARVETTSTTVSTVDGVRFVRRKFGRVHGLPRHADGTDDTTIAVIVSSLVLEAVPGRANTYAPDTGATAIRDARGHVVAVTQLVMA